MKHILFLLLLGLSITTSAQKAWFSVTSPDKSIRVDVLLGKGNIPLYSVFRNNNEVLKPSKLGIIRDDADFSKKMKINGMSKNEIVTDSYIVFGEKKRRCSYKANKRIMTLKNAKGEKMNVIFQVSDDGVAFCYHFIKKSKNIKKILEKKTSFKFPLETKAWLHPHADAQTGWANTQPSYEENYYQDIKAGTPAPQKAGWSFPALFHSNNCWVLISESGVSPTYCGSRLSRQSPEAEYTITFPQDAERTSKDAACLPETTLPLQTPWRVIVLGDLADIVETTLISDLAEPSKIENTDYIKPGRASWSWALLKDNSVVYDIQKLYIDMAANMGWKYCLVDVEWNKQIGYDKIQELINYAASKDVGILLWYNSSGSWNTTTYAPKNMMFDPEIRKKEFERISKMGVKGIKVDFWAGDGQSVIQYYYDLFSDAAKYNLLVNTHGTTITRGWSRTFPNLMTMEAVKGFEFVTFEQKNADVSAAHCATLPFTRNVVGPMDYTPMSFSEIPGIQRKTSNAFELALSVLFQSGIQHYAETPIGMAMQPDFIKDFSRKIPDYWEDIKFIDGYPSKYAVLARKYGNKWFVAGINATDEEKTLDLDLSKLNAGNKAILITDGKNARSFSRKEIKLDNSKYKLSIKPQGGFVMLFE